MTRARELAELGSVYDNNALTNRNLVINGAMQVAQRGTSSTGLGASSGYFTVDRFNPNFNATAGRLTMTQETITDLPGFTKCIKYACTTADTSIASNEEFGILYRMEGQDLQQFKKGTSGALRKTLSFYVKGNASATYVVELMDSDNSSRHIGATFSVTTDWTRVEITFPGDTTGALDDDSAASLDLQFFLHAGSNNTSGTLQTDWGALDQTARAVGNVNLADSTDNEWYITGVQLEVGSTETPFEYRSFGEEKKLCERYYFQTQSQNFAGVATSTNRVTTGYRIPDMRATPSFTFISYNGTTARLSRATNNADTTFSSASVSSLNGFYQITSSSNTFTANDGYFAQLKCDAEL